MITPAEIAAVVALIARAASALEAWHKGQELTDEQADVLRKASSLKVAGAVAAIDNALAASEPDAKE